MARSKTWRKDRITSKVDPATGRRVVNLPAIPGMTTAQRNAVFAFEAGVLGTLRATIRAEKRAHGQDLGAVPYKLAAAGIPADLTEFYPEG